MHRNQHDGDDKGPFAFDYYKKAHSPPSWVREWLGSGSQFLPIPSKPPVLCRIGIHSWKRAHVGTSDDVWYRMDCRRPGCYWGEYHYKNGIFSQWVWPWKRVHEASENETSENEASESQDELIVIGTGAYRSMLVTADSNPRTFWQKVGCFLNLHDWRTITKAYVGSWVQRCNRPKCEASRVVRD
jgi:hypothetical protein